MQATLKMQSGVIYEVLLKNYYESTGVNTYPMKGEMELDEVTLEQFQEEAKSLGSWQAAMEVSLVLYVNGKPYELEILLKDIPIISTVSFVTTKVIESPNLYS